MLEATEVNTRQPATIVREIEQRFERITYDTVGLYQIRKKCGSFTALYYECSENTS